jgi:hypothetical protein
VGCLPSFTLFECFIEIFAVTGCRRIPVVHNGQLQRIITRADMVEWFVDHLAMFNELRSVAIHRLPPAK